MIMIGINYIIRVIMKVKKIGTVAIILMFGYITLATGATEDEIMKAMAEISTTTVMKSSAPKIVSESEPMVLSSDKPKIDKSKIDKLKVKVSTKQTNRKIRKRVKIKHKRVNKIAEMEDLPMAKSYPMSYDVSQITE
jgi:DNA polymerase elongation subunit (family B)